jgi:hypothetical protein
MSVEASEFLYPQTPVEDEHDIDLLWADELEYMTLLKKKYIHEFAKVNLLKRGMQYNESVKLSHTIPLRMDIIQRKIERGEYLNGETIFYELNPDWFNYMILGRDFLARQSKQGIFHRFMPFQVDFQRTFIDPFVYRMGAVASRGGSKSWLGNDCCVIDAALHPGAELSIVAGSEKQSQSAYDYAKAMCEDKSSGVRDLLDKPPTKQEIVFKPRRLDGEIDEERGIKAKIFNLATSQTSVRGPRASKIFFDEVTQIPSEIIESTLGQAITSPNIKVIWTGTPDDPGHIAHTKWWINPPSSVKAKYINKDGKLEQKKVKCHHWINYYKPFPKISWHLFHWDSYDCHTSKGGWITEEAIQVLLATYTTYSKRRREIYGLWTSSEGNIVQMEDIEQATKDFNAAQLPAKFSDYDGFVVAVDGARHRHYSTIVIIGFKNFKAYVLYAEGWDHIKEPKLRKHVMSAAGKIRDKGGLNILVVIEDATISATLIDNVMDACKKKKIKFMTSTFKKHKLNFVDKMVDYFETKQIKIPESFNQLLDEITNYRWSKNVDQNGKKLPEKGGDDFIDALMHGLYADWIAEKYRDKKTKKGDVGKLYAGGERIEKKRIRAFKAFRATRRDPFGA